MANLEPNVLIIVVTSVVSILGIVLGTIMPTYAQGKAAAKTLEGIARQPDAAPQLRSTMIISVALLETASIYVLLVVLIVLFANPLLSLL